MDFKEFDDLFDKPLTPIEKIRQIEAMEFLAALDKHGHVAIANQDGKTHTLYYKVPPTELP